MVGRNPGQITQQGQVLGDLFARTGYSVTSVSAFLNRYKRLIDIIWTLIWQRKQTDVVILEVYGGRSFVVEDIASWLSSRLGLRTVMWLHGGALPEFMARSPRWSKRVLRRASLLVAPSEFLARAVAHYGFEARIIPNVIDLDEYSFRYRRTVKPNLFWMRCFHPTWNPAMAVRVLAQLRTIFPEAQLVMAGPDKGSQSEIQRLAISLGVADRVRFVGFLDICGKAREGNASDVLVNTNRVDNTPVAIIEACAMGLPVVSTNVGGIADLLTHGQTGLLVTDDDDAAMVAAVETLVNNPELAERLSRNGRLLAERFSWEQVRPQWEILFAQLLSHPSELISPSLFGTKAAPSNQRAVDPAMMETS